MLTREQIFDELAKDSVIEPTPEASTIDDAMKRLDETNKKFDDLQASINSAFEKTVADISSKLINQAPADDLGDETHNNDEIE